jgi:hypothetical protein
VTEGCVLAFCTNARGSHVCVCTMHARVLPRGHLEDLARCYSPTRSLDEQGPGFHRAKATADAWLREQLGGEDSAAPRASWDAVVRATRERDAARAKRSTTNGTEPDARSSASDPQRGSA